MNKTSRTNSEQSVSIPVNTGNQKSTSTPEISPSPSSTFLRSSTSSQASDDSHFLTASGEFANSKEAEEFMQQGMKAYEQRLMSASTRRGGEVEKKFVLFLIVNLSIDYKV